MCRADMPLAAFAAILDLPIRAARSARVAAPVAAACDLLYFAPVECYSSFRLSRYRKVRKMLATMTSKGQITIPKPARDALQLRPGDRVEFVLDDDGRLFLLSATRPLASLKGLLPKPARAVSLEEMDAAIAASGRP